MSEANGDTLHSIMLLHQSDMGLSQLEFIL